LKAILNDANIIKTGTWKYPAREDIGYLDQHYATLELHKSAVELIQDLQPQWTIAEIRNYLNTFLLRKNEEVMRASQYLSGGERVRLSLAMIAAKPPKLLILDEISNNLDLETKEHVSQILKNYPGSLLMVDHDHNFLMNLNLDSCYRIHNQQLLAE
ncbi:MAG: ABC-F family ATP-binding cassette domain-containing protein, partial [Burkholderiales bacterium]|nr:ABC-F family ATP-binding cassette domain-containing protein [Burkholderiales bacterium]